MPISNPKKPIKITTPMRDMTSPLIARPLGCLVMPIAEKINPRSQMIQPMKGIQPRKMARIEKTKPLVPIAFDGTGAT